MWRSLRFWILISRKGAKIGFMLPLNSIRKRYMGVQCYDYILLQWPWKVNFKPRLWGLVFRKRAELGHVLLLLLNIIGNHILNAQLYHQISLWVTLERSKSLRFWNFVYHKGTKLGYILLFNTNRKSYMRSPSPSEPLRFTLGDMERSNYIIWLGIDP